MHAMRTDLRKGRFCEMDADNPPYAIDRLNDSADTWKAVLLFGVLALVLVAIVLARVTPKRSFNLPKVTPANLFDAAVDFIVTHSL